MITPVMHHMTNGELIQSAINSAITVSEDSDGDSVAEVLKKTFSGALKAAKILIQFCESLTNYLQQETLDIHQLGK